MKFQGGSTRTANAPSPLLAHRAPGRWDYYVALRRLSWSEPLGAWVSADRGIVTSVLKSQDFVAIDFKAETGRLSRKLGLDLGAMDRLLDFVPLGQEGALHAATRKQMAVAISRNTPEALNAFAVSVGTSVKRVFAEKTRFDIVAEVFRPCLWRAMCDLAGIAIPAPAADAALPLIFDKMLSLNRRKKLSREIAAIFDRDGEGFAPDEVASRLAILVIGSDSILGSIGESFIHEIERSPGKRMSEIDWSPKLPVTAVPYVDRIAGGDCDLAGERIRAGERVRVYLDAFKTGDVAERDAYFGTGRHACLGKSPSMQMWRTLTSVLATVDSRVAITDARYRKSDYLFNVFDAIEIEVFHD